MVLQLTVFYHGGSNRIAVGAAFFKRLTVGFLPSGANDMRSIIAAVRTYRPLHVLAGSYLFSSMVTSWEFNEASEDDFASVVTVTPFGSALDATHQSSLKNKMVACKYIDSMYR